MPKAEGKEGDWFAELDEELEKKMLQITDNIAEQSTQKVTVNKSLLEDFYRVQMRFNKINVHFTLSPESTAFLKFTDPEHWALKQEIDFDFGRLDSISLGDRSQGRVGDALKAWYYSIDSQVHLRIVFEFCEGEHYYKYAGWKRIFSQYVLIDVPVAKFDGEEVPRGPGRRRQGLVREPPETGQGDRPEAPQGQVREGRDLHAVIA